MFRASDQAADTAFNFKELLEKIYFLATSRASAGVAMGARKKVFISYAWEADPQDNKVLQDWLEHLQMDLQTAGMEVFLDVADMSGNMSAMMKGRIEESEAALVIGTPRLGERAAQETNVAFEIKTILERAEEGKLRVLPLLVAGDFNVSFPKPLLSFLVRDFRNEDDYMNLLIDLKNPQGVIPAIWDFRVGDMGYEMLLREYNVKAQMAGNPLGMAFQQGDRLDHKLQVMKAQRTVMSPEASRTTALQLEKEANDRSPGNSHMELLTKKMVLDTALPYFIDGFGEDHEKTLEVKRTLESLAHLDPKQPVFDMGAMAGMGGMGGMGGAPAHGAQGAGGFDLSAMMMGAAMMGNPQLAGMMQQQQQQQQHAMLAGNPHLAALMQQQQEPVFSRSLAANPFVDIHAYLLEKISQDKGRIQDFSDLLRALVAECSVSSISAHLASHPDFHHHSIFKGNRYHDLRNRLLIVGSNDLLHDLMADYLEFLEEESSLFEDAELKRRILANIRA